MNQATTLPQFETYDKLRTYLTQHELGHKLYDALNYEIVDIRQHLRIMGKSTRPAGHNAEKIILDWWNDQSNSMDWSYVTPDWILSLRTGYVLLHAIKVKLYEAITYEPSKQ